MKVDNSIPAVAARLMALPDPDPLTPAEESAEAIAAAHQATEAAAELLRFAREGAYSPGDPFSVDLDVIAHLAEATRTAITLAKTRLTQPSEREYLEGVGQLSAAISNFLADWS